MRTDELDFGKINVTRVYESEYQKNGTLTAELKQIVKKISTYSADDSLNDELFEITESPRYESSETRVYWVNVPMGSTAKDVANQLAKHPNARLYKISSLSPIVTESEKWAIGSGMTTLDTIEQRQLVKYPQGSPNAGEPILFHGEKQYRRICLSLDGKEDVDYR